QSHRHSESRRTRAGDGLEVPCNTHYRHINQNLVNALYSAPMSLVFMQLSDLHLGARLVNLPGEIAEHLRNSTREIVVEAFEAAKAENADLILMPGDLYDHNGIDASGQLHFIYELAASLAPTPVVIAP